MPSPLTTTFIQSTILNAISNILAQIIDQYQEDKPFTLNILALLQFVAHAIILVPINFSWQKYLETQWPGFPSSRLGFGSAIASANANVFANADSGSVIVVVDEELKEKPASANVRASGMRNFAMKFLLDQTVGSVMNIILFIVLINLLKGSGWGRIVELIREDFGPIMIARLKYRPVVSTLLFTVVPLDRRVVFGSACGVVWGVYLSLYAAV